MCYDAKKYQYNQILTHRVSDSTSLLAEDHSENEHKLAALLRDSSYDRAEGHIHEEAAAEDTQ